MQPHVYHLFSHTILHCGTGQSVGIVDQPIARDRATNLPLVPGSTMKGVLRAHLETDPSNGAEHLFGPKGKDVKESFAGALSITDAHLLVLPVRSVYGVIAYATCPFILKRYRRDMNLSLKMPEPGENRALHATNNANHSNNQVVLEDLDFRPKECPDTQAWAEQIAKVVYDEDTESRNDLIQRFLVLPDNAFSFLAETATEIRTRIRINPETGVVSDGALWTEENLPAETLLWGLYTLADSRQPEATASANELHQQLPGTTLLQMGGSAGTGHGLVQFHRMGGQHDAA